MPVTQSQPKPFLNSILKATLVSTVMMGLAACSPTDNTSVDAPVGQATFPVSDAMLTDAASQPAQWMTYGGTYEEQRFARLDGITQDNVGELGLAWSYDLATARGVEAIPIVVDGVMYVTGAWSIVYAVNAKTGEVVWSKVTVDQSSPIPSPGRRELSKAKSSSVTAAGSLAYAAMCLLMTRKRAR